MKKILIVEDDNALGTALVTKLSKSEYDVKLVEDGLEVISTARGFKPDLILLDIILPHKNGYEILDEMTKDAELNTIPVIVISNSGQPVEISRILALGVKDYIVKAQFNPEELLEKVRTQLEEEVQTEINTEGQNSFSPSLSGKSVLWVEDDEFLGDIVEKKLSGVDCKLTHVKNGEDALKFLEANKADIVVLDVILPMLDGYEILKRIKENPNTASVPVILLSNLGQPEDIEKGKKLGAELFLIKATFTLDEVLLQIAKILAK